MNDNVYLREEIPLVPMLEYGKMGGLLNFNFFLSYYGDHILLRKEEKVENWKSYAEEKIENQYDQDNFELVFFNGRDTFSFKSINKPVNFPILKMTLNSDNYNLNRFGKVFLYRTKKHISSTFFRISENNMKEGFANRVLIMYENTLKIVDYHIGIYGIPVCYTDIGWRNTIKMDEDGKKIYVEYENSFKDKKRAYLDNRNFFIEGVGKIELKVSEQEYDGTYMDEWLSMRNLDFITKKKIDLNSCTEKDANIMVKYVLSDFAPSFDIDTLSEETLALLFEDDGEEEYDDEENIEETPEGRFRSRIEDMVRYFAISKLGTMTKETRQFLIILHSIFESDEIQNKSLTKKEKSFIKLLIKVAKVVERIKKTGFSNKKGISVFKNGEVIPGFYEFDSDLRITDMVDHDTIQFMRYLDNEITKSGFTNKLELLLTKLNVIKKVKTEYGEEDEEKSTL